MRGMCGVLGRPYLSNPTYQRFRYGKLVKTSARCRTGHEGHSRAGERKCRMARTKLAQSGAMSDEGRRIQERRERLVMGRRELAQEAGIDRGTLASIEEGGSYQAKTMTKILRALNDA